MAVVYVKPIGRRPANEEGSDGRITLRFRVGTDDPADQVATCLADVRLPRYGDSLIVWEPQFPTSARFRCIRRSGVDSHGPLWFEVDCEFSTKFDEAAEKEFAPLDRRAQISGGTQNVDVVWLLDGSTKALITNTANDPFSPPLRRQMTTTRYQVKYNSPVLEPWHHSASDADSVKLINNAPVFIRGYQWPAKTLLIDGVSFSEEKWGQSQRYYEITATLIGDRRGYLRRILNDGLYELPGGIGAKKRRCRNGLQEATSPVPLRENGEQIPDAELMADPINAPYWLLFHEHAPVDFSTLLPPMS